MAKNLLESKNNVYYAIAAVVVIAIVLILAGTKPSGQSNNAVATPSVQPSIATCIDGQQKEFACVGSISGQQTFYECVNGAWASKSRYNYSECVKTFGPNDTIVDEPENQSNSTNATVTPANATPSVSPTATPTANATVPGFVNMSVSGIRATSADLYWFTNVNATATIHYGDEPGVRRWILAAQFPAFSHYQPFLHISPNTTYYFEVQMCANSTCVTTPTLNFTTPQTDSYFVGDTTIPYPGDQVNFTAAQLNPK